MQKSAIEWTDSTWNPITGCSHASDGCSYCYAEALSDRFGRTKKPWTMPNITENLSYHPDRYLDPVRKRKGQVIFTCSMGDLFHEAVRWDELAVILGCMLAAPHNVYLALTKRPAIARGFLETWGPRQCAHAADAWAPQGARTRLKFPIRPETWAEFPALWLGTSAEDQPNYERRIRDLELAPVAHRFLSLEPLLGPIDLELMGRPRVDWVIAGGESASISPRYLVQVDERLPGTQWRPKATGLAWARSLRDQCQAAGIPFHWKQWGGPTPKHAGRGLDGKLYDANPARESLRAAFEREVAEAGRQLEALARPLQAEPGVTT